MFSALDCTLFQNSALISLKTTVLACLFFYLSLYSWKVEALQLQQTRYCLVHCAGHHFNAIKVFYICLLHRKSSTKHQNRDVFMQFSSEFRFCSRKWHLLSLQFQVKSHLNTFLSILVLAYSGIKIAKDVNFSIVKAFEIIRTPRLTFFTNVPKTSRKTTLC